MVFGAVAAVAVTVSCSDDTSYATAYGSPPLGDAAIADSAVTPVDAARPADAGADSAVAADGAPAPDANVQPPYGSPPPPDAGGD